MPRDAEDDEGVAGHRAERHHGDQQVLQEERKEMSMAAIVAILHLLTTSA